jgi:hypothetical protein
MRRCMDSTLLQLLLAWFVGIPAAVLTLALAYPWYLRSRVARARRRVERQLTWPDAEVLHLGARREGARRSPFR